jgi:DNA gyrase/topoisomerase IV subunit B
MDKKPDYNKENITEVLDFNESVRKRPEMHIGRSGEKE